jgi:multidrug resistance protein, MATE family
MTVTGGPQVPAMRVGKDGRPSVSVAALLALAAPLMITNVVQAALNLTDTWFLGRLSTAAVAAMSAIYWLMTCIILVLGGVGLAVQTFVAQASGSGRRARASQAAWNAIWACVAALPLFAAVAFAGPWLLRPFQLPPEIQQLALDYWRPRLLGAALGSMGWALMSFFNGVGATRATLAVATLTMLANVPLNELLIFRLGFGMAGSAWATNLAQVAGLLLACGLMLTGRFARDFRTRLTWRPRWPIVRRQVAVGLPIGLMYGADLLGLALLQLMIVQVSAADAAATQVVIMLTSLAYMPTIGVATAGTTLVGQAIGAGQRDWAARVGNVVIATCATLMFSLALLLLAGGRAVLPAFLDSGDPASAAAVATGLLLLWPAAAYQLFDGLYFGSSFCMRAAGDTRVPAITALGLSWLFFIPLAHTLVFTPEQAWLPGLPQSGLGAIGGWIALMCYAMLLGSSMLLRWRTGRWRRIEIWRGADT